MIGKIFAVYWKTVQFKPYFFLAAVFLLVFFYQWAFAYEQLVVVWRSGPEFIPSFIFDGSIAFYANWFDVIPISITVIALFQAMTILAFKQINQKPTRAASASYGVTFIVSGCVACGSSILVPILSGVSSTLALTSAIVISRWLLAIALIFAVVSWWQAGVNLLSKGH